MFRRQHMIRGALTIVSLAGALSCTSDHGVIMTPVVNPLFRSYVAIGNSITAGFQSDGINDSTQQRSYALLLARQMNTRFAYPSLVNPGCRPPLANFLTQARVGTGSTSTTCLLRNPASVTEILNNVAVPGAGSGDADTPVGPAGSTLTTLFLGGKTQVAKALDARPTFATVWIGNNDVLQPAITGIPGSATPLTTFVTNYAKMINDLVAGAPGIKGVLIGVGQTANIPILFSAAALSNPAFVAGLNAAVAPKTIVVDVTTCTPTSTARIGFPIIAAIRAFPAAGGHPPTIACAKTATPPIGDIFVLDAAEQIQVSDLVNSYNAYIRAKADSIGFAYYDPNSLLNTLTATGQIPAVPNIGSATAPYGPYFSLDGVHPNTAAHILIANDLITVINAKFATNLQKLPTT